MGEKIFYGSTIARFFSILNIPVLTVCQSCCVIFFYMQTGPRDFLSDSSVLDMVASFGSEGLVQIIAALKDISSIRWCLIILRQYEKNTITPGLIKNRLNQYIMRDCKWENMLIY